MDKPWTIRNIGYKLSQGVQTPLGYYTGHLLFRKSKLVRKGGHSKDDYCRACTTKPSGVGLRGPSLEKVR